jgi:hypothetical protein
VTKATAVLAAAIALATLAAGCGGGSRLSHDAFVEQANAICTSYDTAVKKLRTPRTPSEIERYTNRVLPLYRRALGALAALKEPREDAPAVARLLRVDRMIEGDLELLAAAARERRIPAVREIVARARADNARSNRIAAALGLSVCAKA